MLLFKSGFRVQGLGFRKRFFLSVHLFISLAFLLLSACGFTPMYAQNSDNAEISAKLASVEIKPIKTIIGQQYVNALEDVLNPGHIGAVKEYTMEVSVNKSDLALAIAQDRTVTRYKVVVTADYTIKEISSGKVVSKGTVKNESDYDNVNSDYATYVSESDTASRAIRELAQDTKIKIISALLK